MKYNPQTRRFFLQSAIGSMMTLPVLPSLIPKAQAQSIPRPKFLVMIGSNHGGTGGGTDWYPRPVVANPLTNLLTTQNLFNTQPSGEILHRYRYGLLQSLLSADPGHAGGNVDNGGNRISFILGRFLNPVVSKMNFYRGVDIGTFYSGHHRGVFGGNIGAAVNNSTARDAMIQWPTLDQFLANSTKFYGTNDPISQKVISISGEMSFQADGSSGPSLGIRFDRIYDAIFSKYTQTSDPAVIAERQRKQFLIDQVLGDYRRLSKGAFGPARQISSEDKKRVEQHVDLLTDVQRKYQSIINSCSDVTGPNEAFYTTSSRHQNGLEDMKKVYDLLTDLMVAAFQCGASKLGMISGGVKSEIGNYHQDIAHQASNSPDAQLKHNQNFRWQAEHIVAVLVNKMNAIDLGGGQTLLDRSLVTWTHECGEKTHQHPSVGLTTFGGLDGFFKTGNFIDFRNLDNLGLRRGAENSNRPGVPIQRLWANIIQGMGYLPSEYERFGRPGYGDSTQNDFTYNDRGTGVTYKAYPKTMMDSLSDRLPIVT